MNAPHQRNHQDRQGHRCWAPPCRLPAAGEPVYTAPQGGRSQEAQGRALIAETHRTEYPHCWPPSDSPILPPCGERCHRASGRAGKFVSRVWFDGSLSVKEMGALLFMRAGTGKGRRVFRRELQARFGWSHPTTGKVIAGLEARGLLIKHEAHRDGGRFVGAPTYEVQQLLRDRLAAAGVKKPGNGAATNVKKPGDGLPGNGFAANYYLPTDPQDAPPSGAPLGRTVSKETGQCGSQCETRVTRRKDCQTEGCKNAAVGGRGERGVL